MSDFLYFIQYYMIPNLELPFKVLLLVWFIQNFEPLRASWEAITEKVETLWRGASDNLIWLVIRLLMECSKCQSFWIGLLWSGNFFLAVSLSLFVNQIEKMYEPDYIELPKIKE